MTMFIINFIIGAPITAFGIYVIKKADVIRISDKARYNPEYELDENDIFFNRLRGIVTLMIGVLVIVFGINHLFV